MFDPPHPGEILREECLVPLALSVTKGAAVLGVTRQTLNNLVNENPGSARKWRCGWKRRLGRKPGFGSGCKRLMIWRRSAENTSLNRHKAVRLRSLEH